jgi:cellulose synthase/poly-beta-1,6-N-acetylglucosamine synthase-like glycosyltransferase/peptidoglycan/xylan/chitin deacetylase (PgdA/CDA1 family)/spore germination protein YaaH
VPDNPRSFVFHDPSGKRWQRFRRGLQTGAIFFGILLVLFVLSMAINPQIPALGLPPVEHLPNLGEVPAIIRGERPLRNVPFKLRKAARNIKYVRSASPELHPKTAARVKTDSPVVFGFYVNWDPASMVSLRMHLSHLTHLVPEWLILRNAQGDLDDQSDPTVMAIAAQAKLPILAQVTNYRDGWQPAELRQILHNAAARAALIENIYRNLTEHRFAGVNVDFEDLTPPDRQPLVAFMGQLRAKLQAAGLLLTAIVPIEDQSYDLKQLAQVDDYLVPMVYDEHYQSGEPGPIASQPWFQKQIDRLGRIAPPEKIVIGMGNYGYDWTIGGTGSAETSFGEVMSQAASNGAGVAWDAGTANPVQRYQSGGQRHEVWFLDAVTALNQARGVADGGFRGIALWRLGAEDPDLWNVLPPGAWPAADYDPRQLSVLTAEKSVNQYGDGDVLRIVQTPHDGGRGVWRNSDGRYAEQYGQLPSYYTIESSGGAHAKGPLLSDGKVLCLTFDDGPDPRYTPRVLDILRSHGVRATFFIIGANADRNIGLVKREYFEGHDIGNHTYTHPNIALVSEERATLELGATQRIIENALGVSTVLFRPPYNADSQPQTPEEILPVLRAQKAGYVTVGERIDPRDWVKGVSADGIVSEIRSELQSADDPGHVILLHDAGGDRSATVAALPRILEGLQAQGYRFVPLSELLGQTRAQLMPAPSGVEMRWARIEGEAFDFQGDFEKAIGMLFLGAIYLTLARSLFYGILALAQKWRVRHARFDTAFRPPVSVIIAAFNEEKVIVRTVESILRNGYDDPEVIVVDDGSTDATLQVLRQNFGDRLNVRILSQPNGGKSSALNNAIAHARRDILIALDADTIFRVGAIGKLVRHFADAQVGAVSGNARVGNRKSWITRFQSIEYIYGFNLDRRALDLLNAITVVPGAVGAWRKDLVLKLGGFGGDTLAEDTDLTLKIRRAGYRIRYEEEGVAFTEAPEDMRGLAKQRFRWAFGTLQAAWKHRDALFVPKYGSLGFVALPSIWIFQVLLAALSPFAELAMIVALFAGNWRIVLMFYFAFFVLEFLTGLMAYRLEGELPWDLALLFFQRIYYRELMYYVVAKSLIYAMRGRVVGWGKLERRATVQGI